MTGHLCRHEDLATALVRGGRRGSAGAGSSGARAGNSAADSAMRAIKKLAGEFSDCPVPPNPHRCATTMTTTTSATKHAHAVLLLFCLF